jgi:hypothetical protein
VNYYILSLLFFVAKVQVILINLIHNNIFSKIVPDSVDLHAADGDVVVEDPSRGRQVRCQVS